MARKESCNKSKSDGITRCSDDGDIDDDAVDADEREAVDGKEQHDDDDEDADSAVSAEQSGPPVGLYLKDNMVSGLSTFISCPEKNEEFCTEAFTRYPACPCLKAGASRSRSGGNVSCAGVPRSGGKEPLNVPRPLLRSDFRTSRVDRKSAGYAGGLAT